MDPGLEFQYLDSTNGINVDFGPDYINILEFPVTSYSGGLNSWIMYFQFSNPIIADVKLTSTTFSGLIGREN